VNNLDASMHPLFSRLGLYHIHRKCQQGESLNLPDAFPCGEKLARSPQGQTFVEEAPHSPPPPRIDFVAIALLWIARVTSILVLIPVLMILIGERGTGPGSIRAWIYLSLFPCAFTIGYLIAWRLPLLGGTISLACMIASLLVLQHIYPLSVYLIWGVICVPGILFIIAGWRLRLRKS
jgi:hypothetical protein